MDSTPRKSDERPVETPESRAELSSGPEPRLGRSDALALALVALALAVRLVGIRWGLPHVYEETVAVSEAWNMWGWGPGHHPDFNPHFFRYPSLVFYLQFLGQLALFGFLRLTRSIASTTDFRLLYLFDPTPFILTARLVNVAFATATVWTTYRLARRVAGPSAGLLAALWLGVDAFHAEQSQSVLVDVPLVLFVTWGLHRCVRLAEAPTSRNYILAGLGLGFAASTKYPGALLALPLGVAHLHTSRSAGGPFHAWRRLVLAGAAALAAFAVTSPFVLLSAPSARADLLAEREHMESGHFGSDDSRAWSYDANALGRRILGAPLALAAIAGVVWLGAWRRRPAAVILGSFVVGYSLIVGSWAMKAERYLLPILPASLVLAASAVTEAHGRLVELRATRPLVRVASLTLLAILFAAPLVQGLSEIRDRTRADTRTLAQEWIETHCPTGALIVSEAYGPEVRRVSDLWRAPPDLAETIRTRWQSSPYYAIQTLPLYQVRPETSGAFYDRSLYRDADLFVITSDVRDRYEREPQRFARQLAFYAELRASCSEVAEFRPDNGPGPTITIYFDPAQEIPFGYRTGVAGPSAPPLGSGAAAPEVASFLWQMGLNYELFGFLDPAVRCYDMGLAMGRLRPDALRSLAFGKARCLAAAGHLEEATLFLGRAAEACSSPREAEALRGYRDELAREGSAPGERP